MRKKNYKGAKCTKRYVKKCEDVCKTYDAIQYAYASLLSKAEDVQSFRVNVLLEGLQEGDYTSDFVIVKADGGLMIRECVSRRHLTKPMTAKLLDSSRNYWKSRGDVDYSFIVPGHALGELSKILADGEEELCYFYLSRKHAIVNKGNIVFFTRLIDSEYIDYNKIIPRDNNILVTVDRDRLLSGLERANIIAEEKIQGSGRSYVKLSCEGHYLNLTSTSVNGGVTDEMDCVHEGDDIDIGFNCRYLIDAVKAAEGEELLIKMKSSNQAITIEPKEITDELDYFYLILPVRMNENN